ncbi:MAG TPA: hypothetical protein PKH07_15440 [bacterium]|nr:hypothetical protein [bacterium]
MGTTAPALEALSILRMSIQEGKRIASEDIRSPESIAALWQLFYYLFHDRWDVEAGVSILERLSGQCAEYSKWFNDPTMARVELLARLAYGYEVLGKTKRAELNWRRAFKELVGEETSAGGDLSEIRETVRVAVVEYEMEEPSEQKNVSQQTRDDGNAEVAMSASASEGRKPSGCGCFTGCAESVTAGGACGSSGETANVISGSKPSCGCFGTKKPTE